MNAGPRPQVLMTLPDIAWPLVRGKALRVESLLRAVAASCDVDALVLWADGDRRLRPFPDDVPVRRWSWLPPAPVQPWRAAGAVLRHRVPWQTAVQDWSTARAAVQGWPDDYDVVWFGALDHAVSLGGLRRGRSVVVDCDDVETAKLDAFLTTPRRAGQSRLDRLQRRVELPLWRGVQRAVTERADAVLVCSELDRGRLAAQTRVAPDRIAVVPNTYRKPAAPLRRDPERRCRVLVVANYGTDQNVDAAQFAVREVLPALRRRLPHATLRLVGRQIERVGDLDGSPGLDLVGPVEDVGPELAVADVVLVPIRYGGGTRLKILEAFAHEAPVVSTTAGAEGLDVVDGEHLLLADTAQELAAAIDQLSSDPALGLRLARSGQELWRTRYSPQASADRVRAVLDRVLPA